MKPAIVVWSGLALFALGIAVGYVAKPVCKMTALPPVETALPPVLPEALDHIQACVNFETGNFWPAREGVCHAGDEPK